MQNRPLWSRWARVVVRHPRIVLLATTAAMLVSLAVVLGAPKDLSFTGILSEHDPEFGRYRAAIEEFGDQLSLVLLLEGDPEDIAVVRDRLVEELPADTELLAVLAPPDPQWLLDRAPYVWPPQMFQSALALAVLPADRAAELSVHSGIAVADRAMVEQVQPTDRAMVLSLILSADPFDMALGGIYYEHVQKETARIVAETGLPVTARFSGISAIGAEDQNSVLKRVVALTPLVFIVVLLMLRGVERRLIRLVLAGIALAGSVGMAYALVVLLLGKMTIMSTFFGLVLLGLGIDFAIHLLVALRDERAHGKSPDEAVVAALVHVGPPIVAGGLTSALATGVVTFVPEPGSKDMGLTATFGLISAMVLMLSFLPAGWLLFERRHAETSDPPAAFRLPGLAFLVRLSLRYPKIVTVSFVVLTVAAALGLPYYTLETDLARIFTRDVPALEVQNRIEELYDAAPAVYLATVSSLEEARDLSVQIAREPFVGKVTSAADWIRPDQAERVKAMETALRLAEGEDHPIRARLRRALEVGPVTPEQVPPAFRVGTIGKTGALAVRIEPKEATLDAVELREHEARLKAIAPTVTGAGLVAARLISGQRDWVPLMCGFILAIVVVVLVVTFRHPRHVILALLPVVSATILSIGSFCWLGIRFNVLTSIVVPIVLGLGVDDGIHLMARLRQHAVWDDDAVRDSVEGVGRAVFLTSATTAASFLGLVFSNHPGLEGIAFFMLVGVPACFLASVTLLPAVARLLGRS